MNISRVDAEKFLRAFDPSTDKFTFQTFDDRKDRKDPKLVRVLHGTLAEHWKTLSALNAAGAGVYITVNETDFKGRKVQNIIRVRYLCVDLDGAPLEPAKTPQPRIIVESSPKRWHVYWPVENFPLDIATYRTAQRKLIKRLDSDPQVTDLARVLRMPGFVHRKATEFRSRLVAVNKVAPYKAEQFLNGYDLGEADKKPKRLRINNKQPADISDIEAALEVVDSDSYRVWFEVGCALYSDLGDEKGFELFDRWSRKSSKYDKRQCEHKWQECGKVTQFTIGTLFHYADESEKNWRIDRLPDTAAVEDFVSYLPEHNYIYLPTGQAWPKSSVNARLPKQLVDGTTKRIAPTVWLDRFRKAEAMTWSPGDPLLIHGRVARVEGGWVDKAHTVCLNLYRPPDLKDGNPKNAKRWLDHIRQLYPDDADHLLDYFAQRVQRPGIKINHGLIIAGAQGIGKDSILAPLHFAVGDWNYRNVSPADIMGAFNPYVKAVILQIDELRDMADMDRITIYEHLKTLTAAPPDVVQCNEKHVKHYAVMNVCGTILTSNERTGCIYLPPGDRRFYVTWSEVPKGSFSAQYFNELHAYYRNGGYEDIAAYLRTRDISKFDPKAPPKQTDAFLNIVEHSTPIEDTEFAQALDDLGRPDAVVLEMINRVAETSFAKWIEDRRNAKRVAPRLESCGYVSVRDPAQPEWLYTYDGRRRRVAVYAKKDMPLPKRIGAAKALVLRLGGASIKEIVEQLQEASQK